MKLQEIRRVWDELQDANRMEGKTADENFIIDTVSELDLFTVFPFLLEIAEAAQAHVTPPFDSKTTLPALVEVSEK